MKRLDQLPELEACEQHSSLIRIPEQVDVPVTDRIKRLIDTSVFHRLASIRQLGFVSLVYPGATHTRFEHSLGVYRMAVLFLRRLSRDEQFCGAVDSNWAERFLIGALLHDIGHWPYCHPIEDMGLPVVPDHEHMAAERLESAEISKCLHEDWGVRPDEVGSLLAGQTETVAARIVSSMLSGPIDVDKMDYLVRDSLHCGVPYGRNIDSSRLISSLCLNRRGDGIGISVKGRTAAELLVFARYVMFSEVYWHHAVRSATAMFQRLFFESFEQLNLNEVMNSVDNTIAGMFEDSARRSGTSELFASLFGSRRRLYKRWAQFSYFDEPSIFLRVARQPYSQIVLLAAAIAKLVSRELGASVGNFEVLVDAPPQGLEVQFEIDVSDPKTQSYRHLGMVSPVVQSLARVQFDDYVKQVRLFVHPRLAEVVTRINPLAVVSEALETVGL